MRFFCTIAFGASPPSKKHFVYCGGRPIRVEGLTQDKGLWWKQVGVNDANHTVSVLKDGSDAAADVTDVCMFTDYGFELGTDSNFARPHAGIIRISAFIPGDDMRQVEKFVALHNTAIQTGDEVWTDPATAFDWARTDADYPDWIRREA